MNAKMCFLCISLTLYLSDQRHSKVWQRHFGNVGIAPYRPKWVQYEAMWVWFGPTKSVKPFWKFVHFWERCEHKQNKQSFRTTRMKDFGIKAVYCLLSVYENLMSLCCTRKPKLENDIFETNGESIFKMHGQVEDISNSSKRRHTMKQVTRTNKHKQVWSRQCDISEDFPLLFLVKSNVFSSFPNSNAQIQCRHCGIHKLCG